MEELFKSYKYAEYYVWWFIHCSQGIDPKQFKSDIDTLISKLEKIHSLTNRYPVELLVLERIKISGYDPQRYLNSVAVDDWYDEPWQKRWIDKLAECIDLYDRQYYEECWQKACA